MRMKLLLLTFLLSVALAARVDELMTKDYIIMQSFQADEFKQYSLDFKSYKYIKHPEIQFSIRAIKIKHVGPEIHIYWFGDQSRGNFSITKVSKSSEKTDTLNLEHTIDAFVFDMDVHPNEDVIYAATKNGIIKINTNTEQVETLDKGNFRLVKLDWKREVLYFLSCYGIVQFKKIDLKTKSIETLPVDICYDAWDFDFENDEVYLARNKQLFKASIANVTPKKSEIKLDIMYRITCIALGSEYLYLNLDGDTKFTMISRKDGKVTTSINLHTYFFSFGLREGELEEPKPTTVAEPPEDTEPPKYYEQPEDTELPKYYEQPKHTEPPKYYEQPEDTEPQKYYEQPEDTEPPKYGEQPKHTEPPKYYEQPEDTEPPKYYEQPEDTESPKYGKPSKVGEPPKDPKPKYKVVPSMSPKFEATIISFSCLVIIFFFI